MAQKPETTLTNNIRDAIKESYPEAWVFKVFGNPYQTAGVPDLLVCIDGYLTAIEVKAQRQNETALHARSRVTPTQVAQLEALRRAGAEAGVAISVEGALDLIEGNRFEREATNVRT